MDTCKIEGLWYVVANYQVDFMCLLLLFAFRISFDFGIINMMLRK